MTNASVDTQAMSVTPRHFIDEDQPTTPIPSIDSLGTRDDIDNADEAVLTAKFEAYASAAPILVEHHDWQRTRFEETYGHYIKIFTSLETLESIKETSEAIAPGFDLLEEFQFFELTGNAAKIAGTAAKVTLYSGAVTAVFGVYKAGKATRASNLALDAGIRADKLAFSNPNAIGPRNNYPRALKNAKWAKRMKVLGAAGTLLTVGSAAVGIAASIENAKKRQEFLSTSIESYQNWYAATLQDIADLSAASLEMETAITELLDLLGYSTPEELEAFLGGSVQTAGEIQGALRTATRMLCASPPLSASDVATYTGLPPATIARREALISVDPSICTMGA